MTFNLPLVILASASPRRSQLLRELGLEFQIATATIVEAAPEFLSPDEIAQMNAQRKAQAVANMFPAGLVLGADTVVCLDGKVFGKPVDFPEAVTVLSQLQGRSHQVITGVCLIWLQANRQRLFAERSEVQFRPLTEAQIVHYLRSINPLDKAGAYAIQEQGHLIIEGFTGSLSNIIGLPIERLKLELERWPPPQQFGLER